MKPPRTAPRPEPEPELPPLNDDALAWLLARLSPDDAALVLEEDSKRRLGGVPVRVLAGRWLYLRFSALDRETRDYRAELFTLPGGTAPLYTSSVHLGGGKVAWRFSARLQQAARSLGINVLKAVRSPVMGG